MKYPAIARKLELPVLGVITLTACLLNLRAQWTGIATDPSFTAWIAPLSNRLASGLRFYADGGHMPLPPLSHLVLYWISGGHATWLTESGAHYVMVILITILLYAFLDRIFPAPISFLAAVCAVATYTSSPTILFYNSLATFLATCLGITAAFFDPVGRAGSPPRLSVGGPVPASSAQTGNVTARPPWLWLFALGFFTAAILLTKQSVGAIALPGVATFLLLRPAASPLWPRISRVLAFGALTVLSFAILCAIMSPWISVKGLLLDVFITGSECKGGTREIFAKLAGFGFDLFPLFCIGFFLLLFVTQRPSAAITTSPWRLLPLAALPLLALLALVLVGLKSSFYSLNIIERIGLAACLVVVCAYVVPSWRPGPVWPDAAAQPWRALAILTIVLISAACGYSLSGLIGQRSICWNFDTVPSLQIGLATLFWLILCGVPALFQLFGCPFAGRTSAALAVLLAGLNWAPWAAHWKLIAACRDSWTECRWYDGARVTEEARPLREFVRRVRELCPESESVLLLPADPNLEACFERPRPALTCAIIYTDQYWARYVDTDLDRLRQSPPKVIIIGPKDHWRAYGQLRNQHDAAALLIDRLQQQLLPQRYHLAFEQPIHYNGAEDFLQVYVRND